jgi:hypothetical protein
MATATTVPFLQNAFKYAYNCRKANFMGSQIFNFTFTKGNTMTYNGKSYDVPDQLTVSSIAKQYQDQSTISLKNEKDYDDKFSAKVKGEYTGVVFNGSFNSELSFHGSLFSSSEVEYFVNSVAYQTYVGQRNRWENCLDSDFVSDLAKLPSEMNNNFQLFIDFFDLYGTHFLKNGSFGATLLMQTSVEKSLLKELSEREITAAITAGYSGAVTSGELSASTVIKNSEKLQKNQSSVSLLFQSLGGTLTSDLKEFAKGVPDNPVLLLSTLDKSLPAAELVPISRLCTDAKKAAVINQAIVSYMLISEAQDGMISSAEPVVANTSVKAGTDIIILTSLYESTGPVVEQATLTAKEGQAVNTATAAVNFSPSAQAYIAAATASLPVKANSEYNFTDTGNTAQAFAFSIAAANNSILGAWTPLTEGQTVNAPSDGLVIVNLTEAAAGSSGRVLLSVQDKQVAACSVSNKGSVVVTGNNFCYPVSRNTPIRINASLDGNVKTQYLFVPFGSLVASLSPSVSRTTGINYTAQNDGFLLASLTAAADGNFGTLCAEVYNNGDSTSKPSIKTGTSTFNVSSVGVNLPVNSLCVPVSKGSVYKLYMDGSLPSGGSPEVSINWVDFFPTASRYDKNSILMLQKKMVTAGL